MTKCQRTKKRFKSLDRIHHSNGCCFGDTCVLRAEPGDEKIAKNLKRNLHNGTLGGAKGQRFSKPGGPGNSSKVTMIILRDNITESFMNVPPLSLCLLVQWSYFAPSALWVGDCPASTAIRRSRCRALTYVSAGSQAGGGLRWSGWRGHPDGGATVAALDRDKGPDGLA